MRTNTQDEILNAAQALAQQRGFNAFSYADISAAIGIRKASIHYHFPSKEDLELALLMRYVEQFDEALLAIDQSADSPALKLRRYGELYRRTLNLGAICLCGMMASDIAALPAMLRAPLAEFFVTQTNWLGSVLEAGRRNGEFVFAGDSVLRARSVLASLQGGLIVARALQDAALFDALVDDLLTGIGHR
jgi:TetR/AcrR family transcriptional regulator, transcriptional repressor for nem operon